MRLLCAKAVRTIRRARCRAFVRISFLLLYIFPLAATRGAAQSKYALLIGIDRYWPKSADIPLPPDPPDSQDDASRWELAVWPTLEGAVNDATAMRDLLAGAKFGFPSNHLHLLTDSEATRDVILAAMQKYLVDEPRRGDIVVFYYAGHGSLRVNSKNGRPDHFDETIVPVNANTGVFDVRNKEIARLFNAAVDKGILLTAIFDSCHSGGVARGIPVGAPGKTRFLPYDPRDALDPPDRQPDGSLVPRPEDRPRGAVVLAAAQAHQLASEWTTPDGTPHGAFTVALMDTLSRLPADASAEEILGRVQVLLQGMGMNGQQPALDAPANRRSAPLFGGAHGSGKLRVAAGAEGVQSDGTLTLQGGLELGLNPGCELARVKSKTGDPDMRVVIASAVLGHSKARLIPPATAQQIEPGDEFELEKWAAPESFRLKLWIPPPAASATLSSAFAEAAKLRRSTSVTWIDDPIRTSPDYLVEWSGSAWTLTGPGKQQVLGKDLSAGAVTQALVRTGTHGPRPRLFVELPPSEELAYAVRSQLGDSHAAIELASAPETAQYLLAGRAGEAGPEYAWAQKNVSLGAAEASGIDQRSGESGTLCSPDSPYPPRTNWLAASTDAAAEQVTDYAGRLARVYSWLNLPAPAAGTGDAFPYQLVLAKLGSGDAEPAGLASGAGVTAQGPVREGEDYALALRSSGPPADDFRPRWVYVLGISCDGSGQLLYPASGQNNRQPRRDPKTDGWPRVVDLTGSAEKITIGKPFGVDSYVLLTTSDQLSDLSVFNFQAALSRGAALPNTDPLSQLLQSATTGSRGMGVVRNVPASWSVRYTHILSVPAEPKP